MDRCEQAGLAPAFLLRFAAKTRAQPDPEPAQK
jgi:hypothetical protein